MIRLSWALNIMVHDNINTLLIPRLNNLRVPRENIIENIILSSTSLPQILLD